jgi:hypothetical protein
MQRRCNEMYAEVAARIAWIAGSRRKWLPLGYDKKRTLGQKKKADVADGEEGGQQVGLGQIATPESMRQCSVRQKQSSFAVCYVRCVRRLRW